MNQFEIKCWKFDMINILTIHTGLLDLTKIKRNFSQLIYEKMIMYNVKNNY